MENTNTNPENKNTQGAEAPKNEAPNNGAPKQEENTPFYKKGWFWITVSAVTLGAGAAAGWWFFGKKDAPAEGVTDAAAAA